MVSRMDKYTKDSAVKQRIVKNEKLYDQVTDMDIDYVDIDVNNAVELVSNLDNHSTREDYQKKREFDKILTKKEKAPREIVEEQVVEEDRIYDINEILRLARADKLFESSEKKRLINTEYNILTKLDLKDIQNEDMKKEDLRSLIDTVYGPSKREKFEEEHSDNDDLLSELMDKEELINSINVKEEISKEETKEIETENDEEPEVDSKESDNSDNIEQPKEETADDEKEEKKEDDEYIFEVPEGNGLMIAIIIVSFLIMIVIGFFIYQYFYGI